MTAKQKLLVVGTNAFLEKVNYEYIADPKNQELAVRVEQTLDLVECTFARVSVRITRKIYFDEETYFNMTISSIGDYFLDEAQSRKNFKNEQDMKEYTIQRLGFLVDKIQLGAYQSKIIADLTGSFGRTPLIVPAVINDQID